uniref:TonB-dependent receptor protein n=1 Tax=uncultured bacterium ws198A12 TaxID=1131830 RepID=I1X5K0_9BACT|nr:TonB-dependent receptor protein [uncultured bacterium ws198A12]
MIPRTISSIGTPQVCVDGGDVLVSGLELSTGYSFKLGAFDIPLALRYTWTNEAEFKSAFESDFEPWGDVAAGDELPYIPENQFRLTAGLEHEKFRINLAASYVGKMRTQAGQGAYALLETIDAHSVWDMVAAYNVTEKLSTYVKVDNLLDETYVAARRPAGVRPGLPRTAYLGLTYRL